jgi:hypothetical protein
LPLPAHADGSAPQLARAWHGGGNLVVMGIRNEMRGVEIHQTQYLESLRHDGTAGPRYHEQSLVLVPDALVMEERVFDGLRDRMAVGVDGRFYCARDYDAYRIHVWRPDGTTDRVIECACTPRRRSEAERRRVEDVWRTMTRHWLVGSELRLADTDKCVMAIHVLDDGRLLVLTGRGAFERPAGSLGVFDLFDPRGRLEDRVDLRGEGDPRGDLHFILGGRLFVVRGFMDAILSRQGGAAGTAGVAVAGAAPLAVICYELEI